jgi:hypothetical protein
VKASVESDSSDDEMSEEELAETYKLMFNKWKELCIVCEKQKKNINTLAQENIKLKQGSMCKEHEDLIQSLCLEKKKLQDENISLQEEVSLLESKLDSLKKSLRLLNNGTDALDSLLEESNAGRSKKGIGFEYNETNKEGQKPITKFVTPEAKSEFVQNKVYQESIKKSEHVVQHVASSVKGTRHATWVCHHCGRYGHLKPYCYKLYGFPKDALKGQIPKARAHNKKVWRVKKNESAQIAHTSLRVSSKEDWYFEWVLKAYDRDKKLSY